MALPIAQLGQPVLRRVAEPVPLEMLSAPQFQQFLSDLQATLAESGGVGLAAPQVFCSRRVFLAQVAAPMDEEGPPALEVFINPRIVAVSEETAASWEGCLSFPELLVLVRRPQSVQVEYVDAQGQPRSLSLWGMPARVVQHENDHLDGVLTLDRAASTRDIVKASEIEAVLRASGQLGAD